MARRFLVGVVRILRIVWPVLALLLFIIMTLGIAVAYVEGWTVADGIYFAFVTALTIGYGDLTAKHTLGRFLAVLIGIHGIVFTGVVVAGAVQSLRGVLIETYGNLDQVAMRDSSYDLTSHSLDSKETDRDSVK